MSKDQEKIKSYIPFYWILWMMSLIFILSIFLFKDLTESKVFSIRMTYFSFLIPIVGLIGLVEEYRLGCYLKKNYPKDWEKITFDSGVVFGFNLGFKIFSGPGLLSYVFSKDNYNDQKLRNLKLNTKKIWISSILMIVISIIALNI